jgi:predicted small secreted protein
MKKTLSLGVVLLLASLSLAGCRLNRTNTGLQPAVSSGAQTNPQVPTMGGSPLDQSVGQADHSLNDLQAMLQSMDTNLESLDPGPVDQSLTDLQGALQVTSVPTPTADNSLDQSLDSLLQSVQSEPTP